MWHQRHWSAAAAGRTTVFRDAVWKRGVQVEKDTWGLWKESVLKTQRNAEKKQGGAKGNLVDERVNTRT